MKYAIKLFSLFAAMVMFLSCGKGGLTVSSVVGDWNFYASEFVLDGNVISDFDQSDDAFFIINGDSEVEELWSPMDMIMSMFFLSFEEDGKIYIMSEPYGDWSLSNGKLEINGFDTGGSVYFSNGNLFFDQTYDVYGYSVVKDYNYQEPTQWEMFDSKRKLIYRQKFRKVE